MDKMIPMITLPMMDPYTYQPVDNLLLNAKKRGHKMEEMHPPFSVTSNREINAALSENATLHFKLGVDLSCF